MALATTCTRCKTSFKVVADQLKLRRGMVRCGVCQNVFNGLEQLRYVDQPNPARGTPPTKATIVTPEVAKPMPLDSTAAASPEQSTQEVTSAAQRLIHDWDSDPGNVSPNTANYDPNTEGYRELHSRFVEPGENTRLRHPDFNPAAARPTSESQSAFEVPPESQEFQGSFQPQGAIHQSVSNAQIDESVSSSITEDTAYVIQNTTLTRADDDPHTAFFLPEAAPTYVQIQDIQPPRSIQINPPADLRQDLSGPTGKATYEQPTPLVTQGSIGELLNSADDEQAVDFFSSDDPYGTTHDRAGTLLRYLAVGCLSALLFFMSILWARNWLAVTLPSTKPVVETIAGLMGMSVEVPRNLSVLTIESFDVQSTARPDVLAISAILRNRAKHPVQWPALELTLNGADGRPLLRKVLLPEEYLNQIPNAYGVPPVTEKPFRIGLQVEPMDAKGFQVSIFYP